MPVASVDVRFSNRPFGVKHFQTIHLCGVDVARGLALLFGIGTKALPSWVSTQITGKPASARALNSHCDSGPASNPTRLKRSRLFVRTCRRASGALEHLYADRPRDCDVRLRRTRRVVLGQAQGRDTTTANLSPLCTAAEAIRFAIEELPAVRALGAWMRVGDQRFDSDDIQRLYESDDYPLQRRLSD